ncbi:hypothetical protein Ciccas_004095 [Cichlidogyrus casuarinus]|uniref:Uncharacterized protein n=1 Tax=Cichlidogyrus casuarinus TaxID=1844966 RepID=A0ABD2QDA0_9PLAT
MVQILLDCGASTKQKNIKSQTPFQLAVDMKNDEAIKILTSNMGKEQLKLLEEKL